MRVPKPQEENLVLYCDRGFYAGSRRGIAEFVPAQEGALRLNEAWAKRVSTLLGRRGIDGVRIVRLEPQPLAG